MSEDQLSPPLNVGVPPLEVGIFECQSADDIVGTLLCVEGQSGQTERCQSEQFSLAACFFEFYLMLIFFPFRI